MSIAYALIEACARLRGATSAQVTDYLDFKGVEYKSSSIETHLFMLTKKGLLYKEKFPCKCCKRESTYFYVTDRARASYL